MIISIANCIIEQGKVSLYVVVSLEAIFNNNFLQFKYKRKVLCINLYDITILSCDRRGSCPQDIDYRL